MTQIADSSISGDANTLAYYKFNSGALTTDSSGNGNTLTNNNTVGETASGRYGYAADFGSTNTNKYFSLGGDFGRNGQTVSIPLWFKMTNGADSVELFGLFDSTTNTQLYGGYNGTNLFVIRSRAGVADDSISIAQTPGTDWHHYCVTLSNGGAGGPMILYYDGANIGNTNVAGTNGTTPQPDDFWVGKGAVGNMMKGLIDDLGVYNRVLTGTEVAELASTPSTGINRSYAFII